MALVKLSGQIIHIRGRFGGVYFKKSPDGQHVQAMPRVWNYTRSEAQQGGWGEGSSFTSMGIKGYSGMAAIWMMALLGFFSAAWAAYALVTWFTTKTGERKKITGYNWFVHYALRFPEAERPPFFEPPHSVWDQPNFFVLYKGMWTYEHSPLEWPVEACSGTYYEKFPVNGKMAYRTDNHKWFLWWKDPVWVLSPDLGFETPNLSFYSPDAEIVAYYQNPVSKKFAHVYFGNPEERDLPH